MHGTFNKGLPLRTLTLGEAEQKAISSFGLMTAKPILYIANVDEYDLEGKSEAVMRVREYADKAGAQIVPVCAKLEAEIAELDEPDRTEMLQAVGLSQPALQTVAQKSLQDAWFAKLFHRWRKRSAGVDDSRGGDSSSSCRSYSHRL